MTLVETESPSPEALEAGRKLFAGPVDFVLGAASLEQLPAPDLPEVAVAGRSNVGKSSLLNALTGRKTLARTSNTPGRTQQLNYFRMGPTDAPALYMVDLPGYGFAKASKDAVDRWTRLVTRYLRGRPSLRRVLLLIDARHGLKPNDLEIMALLDKAAVNYQLVLTKLDKLKAADRAPTVAAVTTAARPFVACHPQVLATSAEKRLGLEAVRAAVAALAATPPLPLDGGGPGRG